MNELLVFGDFTAESRGQKSICMKAAISDSIVSKIQASAYSIVNLEAPVINKGFQPIAKFGPNLHMSSDAISYLKNVGVNCVTLANNHFYDYGSEGVNKTIEVLDNEDICHVGGGRNEDELKRILYIEFADTRIAVLNYCETEFSIQKGIGSNQLDVIRFFYDIQEAKKHSDIIITIVHGGHEGYNLPSPRMKRTYRYMIDCGADIVINHHQHCYSGYECYNGKMIYYGLGNFFFDDRDLKYDKLWTEGYFVSIQIEEKKVIQTSIHPYVQCRGNEVFVRSMTLDEENEFHENIHEINRIINDENLLEKRFDDFCLKKKNNYLVVLAPYSNRFLVALSKRHLLPNFIGIKRKLSLLNYVQCESHRDIMLKALKTN